MEINDPRTYSLIGAAMEVHAILGHGFLERVYHDSLAVEMRLRSIPYVSKPKLEIYYKDELLSCSYVPDFVGYESVVVEIKAISCLTTNDRAQLINSLKISRRRVGLLINFGEPRLAWHRFDLDS